MQVIAHTRNSERLYNNGDQVGGWEGEVCKIKTWWLRYALK